MINYDTHHLVIVCYPGYAGGKFLINCLGLSDRAVLQDQELARKQLDGQLATEEKLNLLEQRLAETQEEWLDLNLGCVQLFGASPLTQFDNFNPVIDRLSNSNKYFFMVLHDAKQLDRYLTVWPNAKVIILNNSAEFIKSRNKKEYTGWELYEHPKCDFYWDCSWFLDYSLVAAKMQNLYDVLMLPDYNNLTILRYYVAWMTSLKKLARIDK